MYDIKYQHEGYSNNPNNPNINQTQKTEILPVKISSDKPHVLSKRDGGMLKEQVYEGKYQQGLN